MCFEWLNPQHNTQQWNKFPLKRCYGNFSHFTIICLFSHPLGQRSSQREHCAFSRAVMCKGLFVLCAPSNDSLNWFNEVVYNEVWGVFCFPWWKWRRINQEPFCHNAFFMLNSLKRKRTYLCSTFCYKQLYI